MGSLLGYLKAGIRDSVRLNREWMERQLAGCEGRFLELGPGNDPLLSGLPDDHLHEKWVLEFPGVVERSRRLGYHCLEQDIGREEWKVGDGSMDVVVSCQVLEHIPDVDHAMSECRRVLRPGGKLLVSTPNQGSLMNIVLLLLTINPPYNMVSDHYYGLGTPFSSGRPSLEADSAGHGHLRLFATRAMRDLLAVYGFQVLKHSGGTWGIPLVGPLLARLVPYYGVFTTVLAEKL